MNNISITSNNSPLFCSSSEKTDNQRDPVRAMEIYQEVFVESLVEICAVACFDTGTDICHIPKNILSQALRYISDCYILDTECSDKAAALSLVTDSNPFFDSLIQEITKRLHDTSLGRYRKTNFHKAFQYVTDLSNYKAIQQKSDSSRKLFETSKSRTLYPSFEEMIEKTEYLNRTNFLD
jgi:hypothetical protein